MIKEATESGFTEQDWRQLHDLRIVEQSERDLQRAFGLVPQDDPEVDLGNIPAGFDRRESRP